MKQRAKRISAALLALLLSLTIVFTAVAAVSQSGAFAEKAYTNLVTFSDCQTYGPGAFNNFGKILRVMHDDGLPEPDALLVGGDYSRLLNDYASPAIIQLRDQYKSVYENGIAYGFRVYRITNDDAAWADNLRREMKRLENNRQ